MLSEVRHNVLTALNVNKDGRIELAEFARLVPATFSHIARLSVQGTLKMRDLKMRHQTAGVENAGLEIA